MTKRSVDLDNDVLGVARAELGTTAPNDTADEALRLVAATDDGRVTRAVDALASANLDARADAWR